MSQPSPNPAAIFDLMNSFHKTAGIRAAIELDLFTLVNEGASTADELAARAGAASRGIRILCDYLVVNGVMTKEDSRYRLTAESAIFLDRRSPACIGSMVKFLYSDTLRQGFAGLSDAVRNGGTVLSEQGTMDAEHPVWVEFARSMASLALPAALGIAEILSRDSRPVRRALDLAAGHGLFGIKLAERNPEAEVTALDWAAVLEVAKGNAAAAGISARYHTQAGSAFDAHLGENWDVVLVTNFFHHFSLKTCQGLAERIHRSLAPGGRMVTLEFVPDNGRVSPPLPAQFALIMLATTAEGDAYTFDEYAGIFRKVGFSSIEKHQLEMSPQQVIVSGK